MSQIYFDQALTSVADTKKSADRASKRTPDAKKQAPARAMSPSGKLLPRLKRSELLHVSEQLAVMLDTGVSISDALASVIDNCENPRIIAVVSVIHGQVEQGDALSTALARQPGSFPQVYRSLIVASEKGGMMAAMIDRATTYLRDEQEIIRKVRGALTYPLVMLGFALSTTIFLLSFVLPRFVVMYRGKEDRLPVPTKVLIGISDVLVNHWTLIVPATLAVAWVIYFWLKSESGRGWWHTTQLHVPLLGGMFRTLHLSRGLRMIGTLAGAGVTLDECVKTAEELSANGHYRQLWGEVSSRIGEGQSFSDPLAASSLVSKPVVQMIRAGESSGQLANVTERVAEHAERELKVKIADVTRFIEPAMILVMGGLIGGVTMALLLPVFTVSRVMAQ